MSKRSRYTQKQREDARNRALEIQNKPADAHPSERILQEIQSPDFATKPDSEVLSIALQLNNLVQGVNSIMANQQETAAALAQLQKRIEKAEADNRKWEEDREKFYNEVMSRAPTTNDPLKKEKLQAQGAELVRKAYQDAAAEAATARLQFEELIRTGPKETIVSPGTVEMVNEGGSITTKIFNDVIVLKGHKWILPAGEPVEVPKIVADRFREIQRGRAEFQKRSKALAVDANGNMPEQGELQTRMAKINEEYGTNSEAMPAY